MKFRTILSSVLLWLLSCFATSLSFADGLIVIHHPPMPSPSIVAPHYVFAPLEVKYHHVSVNVDEQIAVTEIDQSFYNPNRSRLEGTYIFPLPKGAEIDKFSMDINGTFVEAELLDAKKARKIYEDIVRKMKDPALLEYSGQGMFKVRIYPIEPLSEKKIKIKYTQLLKNENGMLEYVYPLNTEKFSSKPLKEASVKVQLNSSSPIKTIYSPSHEVEISRKGERSAVVAWEASNVKPDTDFRLYFAPDRGDDISVRVLAYNDSTDAEDGYFLLLASPSPVLSEERIAAKDIVFVLDTSGSMAQGNKITQAKKALQFCLKNLNKDDRFEIVRFSTEAEMLFSGLVEAREGNLRKAERFVDALKPIGGTAIEEALVKAIGPAEKQSMQDRPYYVVFLTDGKPTIGTIREAEIIENIKKRIEDRKIRIFGFGVGTDVDVHLLDKLAEVSRGSSQYVLPKEDLEIKLSNFYSKISEPVLANPRITFSGAVKAHKFHPRKLPDLFKGEQLIILGRYSGKGDAAIMLEGEVNRKTRSITYEASFPKHQTTHAFISKLWAMRRVGFLLDQIRLHGETSEVRDEVVRLARRYGVVTPYTAYLIVEDEEQRRVPLPLRALPRVRAEGEVFSGVRRLYDAAKEDKSGWAAVNSADAFSELGKAKTEYAAKKANAYAMRSPSKSRGEFNKVLEVRDNRFIGGKTFYFNEGRWVDSAIQGTTKAKRVKIDFASEAYFSLLRKAADMPAWLSLGKRVELLFDGTIYEIAG